MKTALENLIVVLKDENTISPYEMCSSGLVQALLTVLNNVSGASHLMVNLLSVTLHNFTEHVVLLTECGTGPKTRL